MVNYFSWPNFNQIGRILEDIWPRTSKKRLLESAGLLTQNLECSCILQHYSLQQRVEGSTDQAGAVVNLVSCQVQKTRHGALNSGRVQALSAFRLTQNMALTHHFPRKLSLTFFNCRNRLADAHSVQYYSFYLFWEVEVLLILDSGEKYQSEYPQKALEVVHFSASVLDSLGNGGLSYWVSIRQRTTSH